MAEVAVIIVNYRTPELTMRCVEALRHERASLPQLRAVVVDGGSDDGSANTLAHFISRADLAEWTTFLPLPINGGFGWANNQAILMLSRETRQPNFIHLLNPDTEVGEGAVTALLQELLDIPDCGAAGSQLLTADGRRAASAFRFPSPGRELTAGAQSEKLGRMLGIASTVVSAEESCDVDWVTGASVMFRADALRQTGLFDDGFFLYFEEVELMHRLHAAGWRVRHVPKSRVVHIEGASTGIGAATAERPHPVYWYESRCRYFRLTGGRGALAAANAASLGGKIIAASKSLVGRPAPRTALRTRELFRRSSRSAQPASIPAWGDPPGVPPAWMQQR